MEYELPANLNKIIFYRLKIMSFPKLEKRFSRLRETKIGSNKRLQRFKLTNDIRAPWTNEEFIRIC